VNRERQKVQAKTRSDTWKHDQLTRSAVPRQAGSTPDWTCVTEQEGTVNPAGEMTGEEMGVAVKDDGNGTQNELKREWDNEPIFPWEVQDVDPDPMSMQPNEETMQTPPIMGSFPQARPQRRRRMLRRLEDYKLKRVKRARHCQVNGPIGMNCGKVALEKSEPVSLTLRCNMIRSETRDLSGSDRRSDSFDFAGRIFGDGRGGHYGAIIDPSRRIRHSEHRCPPDFDCRRFFDGPPPFDPREMECREMERQEMERRRWEERSHQPFSPQFERGRRPF